jgi:hypothetical protein
MNRARPTPLLDRFARRLNPYLVFLGIIVGFAAMVFAGRWAGRQNLFVAYKRGYQLISPEGYFYPSLNNLIHVVRHGAPRNRILVLVGGDSVLNGVGQKREQLWTDQLQRLLGPDFAVVNLAFRGAYPTEMAAVIAEVLSKDYPRLVYVSRTFPMSFPGSFYGTFGYLFWQARASGQLIDFKPRSEAIHRVISVGDPKLKQRISELALCGYLDFWSHASDWWNYLGYNFVFTVVCPLKYPPETFFEPRKHSIEPTPPDVPPIPARFTYPEQSMEIARSFARAPEKESKGGFKIKRAVSDPFMSDARAGIPDALKSRTLIIVSYDAPFFIHQLSDEDYAGYQFDYSEGVSWLRKAGYHSLLVGPNLSNEDYADRTHLTVSGGKNMARDVAREVKAIAVQNGYLSAGSIEANR